MKPTTTPKRQPKRPASGAQRQAKYVSTGRQIACVIRDPDALAVLDRLTAEHAGVTAAVTAALKRRRTGRGA